jgi:long-chain acyl-CoA synthetase
MTSVISPLRRAEQVAAEDTAVICGDLHYSYAQTATRCRRLVAALRGLGVLEGDRVAVLGPNSHRYLELYQAVPGAGMVLVPLNSRHAVPELRYALEDSGAKVLFSARGAEGLDDIVEHVVDLDAGYEVLLAANSPEEFSSDVDDSTLAGLFYTGGTTGASKGVMLTHGNLVANAMHLQACWTCSAETRWMIAAPLFHAAGSLAILATVWNAGRHVVVPAFDAARVLDEIERHGVTHVTVVPTMLAALTEEQSARPRDVSSLRGILHGGAPIATETLRRAHVAFPDTELLHIYGTTETAPLVTMMPHEERLLDTPQARSCGQSAIGVEVAIVGADGHSLATGEVGEVAVRGPNVMVG